MPWRRALCLIKHHAMKTNWVSGGTALRIINLGTSWRCVVSFTPGVRVPGTHWTGSPSSFRTPWQG
jgi:hypothetical protein